VSEESGLPRGWIQTVLGEVTAPTRISVQPTEYPALPFVGMEHVEAETMRLISTVPASELKSSAVRFWPGDVLYGRLRPYLNKVLRSDFEGLCSGEFLVFRKSSNLDSRYLQYFLNSWTFKEFASHLVEGDRPRVDWNQLKEFEFPLPPLAEQHRIVAAIEQQFTRLDAGIAALRQVRAKLKRYRASVLNAAVEGKLTEAWRAEHPATEPASVLLERILKERRAKWEEDLRAKGKDPAKVRYVEPAKPDRENLLELPEGWCWATVEHLVQTHER
jgi:type I restriction enzyme S subunit